MQKTLYLSGDRARSWSLRALRLENKFSLWKFRGPKWSYFVNFRCTCTGRSGPHGWFGPAENFSCAFAGRIQDFRRRFI